MDEDIIEKTSKLNCCKEIFKLYLKRFSDFFWQGL